MIDNTLRCAKCKAPDGILIWRFPDGKWSAGTMGHNKKGEWAQLWYNAHGVEVKAPKMKNANVVTVRLSLVGDVLLCGSCGAGKREQRELL